MGEKGRFMKISCRMKIGWDYLPRREYMASLFQSQPVFISHENELLPATGFEKQQGIQVPGFLTVKPGNRLQYTM